MLLERDDTTVSSTNTTPKAAVLKQMQQKHVSNYQFGGNILVELKQYRASTTASSSIATGYSPAIAE